jgi:hypothetical protein
MRDFAWFAADAGVARRKAGCFLSNNASGGKWNWGIFRENFR